MSTTPTKSLTHREMFFHFNVNNSARISDATVFAREEVPGSRRWSFAVSMCSHSDQFCRRTGRNVARRRYFQAARHHQSRVRDRVETYDCTAPSFSEEKERIRQLAQQIVIRVLNGDKQ